MASGKFILSKKFKEKVPNFSFGVSPIVNVGRKQANKLLEKAKSQALIDIGKNEKKIKENIARYNSYFQENGFDCPLPSQFERTRTNGFAVINRFVDTMFVSEMTSGLLMGAQDYDKMVGDLVYDLAEEGETYAGMRGTVVCRQGEIIVRDDEGIIASYFQGADHRTSITRQTKSVLFFAFGVAGVSEESVQNSLNIAMTILGPCSERADIHML